MCTAMNFLEIWQVPGCCCPFHVAAWKGALRGDRQHTPPKATTKALPHPWENWQCVITLVEVWITAALSGAIIRRLAERYITFRGRSINYPSNAADFLYYIIARQWEILSCWRCKLSPFCSWSWHLHTKGTLSLWSLCRGQENKLVLENLKSQI